MAIEAPVSTIVLRNISPVKSLAPWVNRAVNAASKQAIEIVKFIKSGATDSWNPVDFLASLNYLVGSDSLPRFSFEDLIVNYLHACILAGAVAQKAHSDRRPVIQAKAGEAIDFDLSFNEAIEALRTRVLFRPEEFLSLDKAARSRAGRVAGEYNLAIVEDIYAKLTQTLAEGGTFRDFYNGISELPAKNGWTTEDGANPWHAQLVFYQNARMAHAAGSYQEMLDAEATHWEFMPYGESCPICLPLIGHIFTIEDIDFFPPLHFSCNCYAGSRFEGIDDLGGLTASEDVDNPAYEQAISKPGAFLFDVRHFGKQPPFDLGGVPEELRAGFRQFGVKLGWDMV